MPVDRVAVIVVREVEERIVLMNISSEPRVQGKEFGREKAYLDVDVAVDEHLEVPVVEVADEGLVETANEDSYALYT